MKFTFRAALVAAAALVPSVAVACLWDYDTLQQERSRFPTALELITGKFLRHSPEFYEWRVRDRHAKLAADPSNLALLDDLAVAYHKTGRNDQAIETVLAAERLQPGRYETASNHGTLLMLAGRWQEGLVHIDRALAINPDAHFGREKYQKALAEYVLARRPDGVLTLPLFEVKSNDSDDPNASVRLTHEFVTYLAADGRTPGGRTLNPQERQAAITGVLGMMRFADHASSLLLEALGSLLSREYDSGAEDAKRLAARAYLKAADGVSDEPAKAAYRRAAANVLRMQVEGPNTHREVKLEQVEADFRAELADANAWYDKLRQDELGWIADGKDVDAEFAKLYRADPEVGPPVTTVGLARDWLTTQRVEFVAIGALLAVAAVAVARFVVGRVRRRAAA